MMAGLALALLACQPRFNTTDDIVRTSMCAPAGVDALAEIDRPVPLFAGLGDEEIAITTSSDSARMYFNQGFKLTVAFNHMEAIRAFKYALVQDPDCAMCHWGVAFALGPNYNAAFDPAVLSIVNRSLEEARARMAGVTPMERGLIEALSLRYPPAVDENQVAFEENYARAIGILSDQFPDDINLRAMHAEALMNLHPWDLWNKEGAPQPWTPPILDILERNLADDPDHIASIHLYIHATEASFTPELAIPYAEKLPELAPGAGHLVHMPSHTYIRTGDYHLGTRVNEEAVKVDSLYTEVCHASGVYPLAYYPHNFHFLAACAAFEGDSKTAIQASWRMVNRLDTVAMRQPGYETIQHYYSIPYYVLAKFSKWEDILALPRPARDLMYPTAIWRYARGLALAGKGDMAQAREELANLKLLQEDETIREMSIWEINTVGDLLDIASLVLEGEIAAAEGNAARAEDLLRRAIAIEDNLNYNEPPDWFFSVRHHLGPLLLVQGKFAAAEELYRRDLHLFPKNGYALNGLYEALVKQGKEDEAKEMAERFREAWKEADVSLASSKVES